MPASAADAASPLAADAPCPCGRGAHGGARRATGATLRYADCCGRWHRGPEALQAPDAETLMRSRYSAYVLDLLDYLLATWHPSRRPAELQANEPGLRWLGLSVLRHVQAGEGLARVSFVARSKLGGRAHRLQENSSFVKEADGRWYYLDAEGDAGH